MRLRIVARYAVCAALLAGALPAPASAQFGGLKRKLKEKIINAAVDGAVNKVMGPDSGTATTVAPGATPSGNGAPAPAPRARKGVPAAAPGPAPAAGPAFNEWVLEIKPDVLDRLERALAAEAAAWKVAAGSEKFSSPAQWDRCQQEELERVEKKFQALAGAGDEQKATQFLTDFHTHKEARIEAKCGVDPREAPRRKSDAGVQGYRAGIAAWGAGDRQYTILKERVQPFCALTGAAQASGSAFRIPAGATGQFLVYTPAEIEAMKPRCAKLMPLFQAAN